jgi:hypothetical protein
MAILTGFVAFYAYQSCLTLFSPAPFILVCHCQSIVDAQCTVVTPHSTATSWHIVNPLLGLSLFVGVLLMFGAFLVHRDSFLA